ncbi:MAG: surface carbohydrate biosynthesis protein [Pseudomonadota bacterium]
MDMPPILLPSETQTREFDAKLILAQRLALRGHPVYVGSRMEMHKQIHRLPRGVYLAKDINASSTRILRIMAKLGIAIAAWDEEAMSIADIPTFQARRIAPGNLALVRGLFALGEQNLEALTTHPDYGGQPIWVTGNPRTDLLRAPFRGYFDAEVAALRARFGDFVLVNSNFGRLNHFLPQDRAHRRPDGSWANVAQGTPEWWTYRQAVMDSFVRLLPALADRYPDRRIVFRPHPSESVDLWRDLTATHENVAVLHEGPVHPWILASAVAIHNMCTTGIESYLLDHDVVAYEEVSSEGQRGSLANALSRSVGSQADLFALLDRLFAGEAEPFAPPAEALQQLDYEMGPRDGPLASDRIAEIVADHAEGWIAGSDTDATAKAEGRRLARRRKLSKQINSLRPGHKNSRAYTRRRWPGLSRDDVVARLEALQTAESSPAALRVSAVLPQIFRLDIQRPG